MVHADVAPTGDERSAEQECSGRGRSTRLAQPVGGLDAEVWRKTLEEAADEVGLLEGPLTVEDLERRVGPLLDS